MVRVVLVVADPILRRLLEARLNAAKTRFGGFDVRFADSFEEAKGVAASYASAIVLFDFHKVDDTLLAQLRKLRVAGPACVMGAVRAERQFYLNESLSLNSAGVRVFLDESDVNDDNRLLAKIERIAASLAGSRVLAFLHGKLPPSPFRAAQITLAAVCELGAHDARLDTHARIGRVRQHLGTHPPVSAERSDVSTRLLLLIELAEVCNLPVSALYGLAAFPSANDACELLHSYAGIDARDLDDPQERDRARARLVQIMLGKAAPDRRRAPRTPRKPPGSE